MTQIEYGAFRPGSADTVYSTFELEHAHKHKPIRWPHVQLITLTDTGVQTQAKSTVLCILPLRRVCRPAQALTHMSR